MIIIIANISITFLIVVVFSHEVNVKHCYMLVSFSAVTSRLVQTSLGNKMFLAGVSSTVHVLNVVD